MTGDVKQDTLDNPTYIWTKPYVEGIYDFDTTLFGYSHKETQALDPRSHVLYEAAYHVLGDADYAQRTNGLITGVFAGASEDVDWLRHSPSQTGGDALNRSESGIYGHKDLFTHLITYSLNLNGLVYSLYISCSTFLSVTHTACRSLLFGEYDLASASGITTDLPQKPGYFCQQGMIRPTDDHCRPFGSQASDTPFGNGAGVVVLRRLEGALTAGDRTYVVIRGSTINNNGKQKIGFVVPGHEGQKAVTYVVYHLAEVNPESIGYVETHGTGIRVSDPIEFAALTETSDTSHRQYCAPGTVKTNIGRTHVAAGVAGLIRTAPILHHRTIPPFTNYRTPNSKLDLAYLPFCIPTQPQEWSISRMLPHAGVSPSGIGGTNMHMILEGLNPAMRGDHDQVRAPMFTPLSASSFEQLDELM